MHEQFIGFFDLEPVLAVTLGEPPLPADSLLGGKPTQQVQIIKQADLHEGILRHPAHTRWFAGGPDDADRLDFPRVGSVMTRVLAFVNASPCRASVLRAAEALAKLVDAAVDTVTVVEPGRTSPSEAHGTRLIQEDVEAESIVNNLCPERCRHRSRPY